MANYPHLHPSVHEVAAQDVSTRIDHLLRDRWVDYPVASQALKKLEALLAAPRRTRMPCMLIFGDSGMGKSMIVEKFRRAHLPVYDHQQGIERLEILAIQMPAIPSQARFYGEILMALGAPCRPSDRLFAIETVALSLLRDLRPRMIIVDEVHHLLAGSAQEQRAALNLLKYLANLLQCTVVALGTLDARTAMQTDPQIVSRFRPLALPRWRDDDTFRGFLKTFEQLLPLREPSRFAERRFSRRILDSGGGITGNITELLVAAAETALLQNRESVSIDLLDQVDLAAA